ncbi:gamma-glutamylcyclotransferase [Glaciecola sp. MH2013]|uniref:gamma-glutamylcyclotransferase n=1 Tax=Glaciecola sp. MH2013 TaxID=2785524 RepID=UPI00189D533D|nr:gamma-glutamylcyclotransferase [Glaciecola sp. MH2013]MBF7073396.1 gamma-glutamylcyclotransferase [Glaciecola sp. MH2013]
MTLDTQSLNKDRQDLSKLDEIWLFGYGSLIYKVDFRFIRSEKAHILGYERRFWQGSHDHRGIPEKPGRVLTLVEAEGVRCGGIAFQVSHDVFDHLDHREKNGYLRYETVLHLDSGREVKGLVYTADADNDAYLGEASIAELAHQIYECTGPSGPNREYVYDLAAALRANGEIDEHVFAIERALLVMENT